MRVSVNRDRCTGSGQCSVAAPEVFDQDDAGTVLLLNPDPGEEHREAVETAVFTCPVLAIEVHES
jgi:ferredoxin